MKHILCYGDSNTHGYIPSGGRYDDDTRYTGILAKLLGSDYRIIEEGLNSRTSSFDDPFEPYKKSLPTKKQVLSKFLRAESYLFVLGVKKSSLSIR